MENSWHKFIKNERKYGEGIDRIKVGLVRGAKQDRPSNGKRRRGKPSLRLIHSGCPRSQRGNKLGRYILETKDKKTKKKK